MFSRINRAIGRRLAVFLSKSLRGYQRFDTLSLETLAAVIQPGDILLIEGNTRISVAIKYLTQSSWSHACLHVGAGSEDQGQDPPVLLEADLQDGVHLVRLSKYADFNIRICRPVGLSSKELQSLLDFARAKLGYQYDLKNILDLVRYLIQKPAVPNRYRRAMLELGSGEPTKAICSTLIAESFQHINYPILPEGRKAGVKGEDPTYSKRHFSNYTPRDFDVSPYFRVVKPTLERGFDFHEMQWRVEPTQVTGQLENKLNKPAG